MDSIQEELDRLKAERDTSTSNLFWEKVIIQTLGCNASSIEDMNDIFLIKNEKAIMIFDGIEDIIREPEKESLLLASLLNLPNRLAALRNQRLYAIVMIRADYARVAHKQNYGQFESKYEKYALKWDGESFLRLAWWTCYKANIGKFTDPPEDKDVNTLLEGLERLWGKKLGKDSSKEAMSSRWVYASLCDLNGNIQARDLIRFLNESSSFQKSEGTGKWVDCILAPEVMRKAIPKCSTRKVEEATAEITALREWSDKLKTILEKESPSILMMLI